MTDIELVDEIYDRFRTHSQDLVEMLIENYPNFAKDIALDIEMILMLDDNRCE